MPFGLLDIIHSDENRDQPVSLREFNSVGLSSENFIKYIGLLLELQGALLYEEQLTVHDFKSDSNKSLFDTIYEKFLLFCSENKLIGYDPFTHFRFLNCRPTYSDAMYKYYSIQYPKEFNEFRLAVERKVSALWFNYKKCLNDLFGFIQFTDDDFVIVDDTTRFATLDSSLRVQTFDSDSHSFRYLTHKEVFDMCLTVQSEQLNVEKLIAEQREKAPQDNDNQDAIIYLPWLKTMDELEKRQQALNDIYDLFQDASETPDLSTFSEYDKLTAVDNNQCSLKGHFLFNTKISLHFENHSEKIVSVCRCSDCQQFQITSQELTALISEFGIPNCQVEYAVENKKIDCNFKDSSIFYDMGYSVSVSEGLSATQRQSILKKAIDQGKTTKQDVISFLLQRISINGMKAGNEKALEKWREDYLYIKNL